MQKNNNPLMCDPELGICEMPENNNELNDVTLKTEESIKIIYFTDPICSSCWGIEPQLRKLKLEYGHAIQIEYKMGGLLPNWNYNSGEISKPSDVAQHWDEVSAYYDMPIDGDVWLEDPLNSSYPPSIAFKAAQLQDNEKAILFLREIREMVFLKKKNIAKWENLELAASHVGLDINRLKNDFEGKAIKLFEEDLKIAKENGIRGFPTILFIDNNGNKETVYGSKPYSFYENAILKFYPTVIKKEYNKDWSTLFNKYSTLTAREFSELSETSRRASEQKLNNLVKLNELEKFTTKNGSIWIMKHNK